MVIVKLYGGLGNQMFQYATAQALAKKLKTNLYLDLAWFEEVKNLKDVTLRVYELDGFGIQPKRITLMDRLGNRLRPPALFKEHGLDYQSEFDDLVGNIILDGYWQSYKYFTAYHNEVLKDFSFHETISSENQKLLKNISKSESISIHVRRGDYNTKVGRSYHGLLPISYYKKAIDQLSSKVKQPTLFIFSDDIDWCKENVRFDMPSTYIDSNGPNKGVDDMQLMSACKHNIIANSSFSWWAAWLNPNNDKMIYAPKNWLAGSKRNIEDLLPNDWVLV